jgi:Resolvase, N terminal domain
MPRRLQPAVAYLRTSRANVGANKDSDKRQRAAIEAFAKQVEFTIVGEYYDAAVSGAGPVDQRPGFAEMLQRLAVNGAKTIIVESPDRFARDLAVQLAGHDMLKGLGIAIIPASAPDFFTEDTPTAVLVPDAGHHAQMCYLAVVVRPSSARAQAPADDPIIRGVTVMPGRRGAYRHRYLRPAIPDICGQSMPLSIFYSSAHMSGKAEQSVPSSINREGARPCPNASVLVSCPLPVF